MHVLAAQAFTPMAAAVKIQLDVDLLCASGWRPHRWDSFEQYEQALVAKYGSVERGRLFLAFNSPHETGLACDFGCGGLAPISATIVRQRATPLWCWLRDHAWQYGWHPYKEEPWHWEYWVDLPSYRAGVVRPETSDDSGPITTCADANDVCVEAPLDEVTATRLDRS
jgi:LAS superfamily LD-carboxypeptidase LdcB